MKKAVPSQDMAGGREGNRTNARILKTMSAGMVRLVVVEARLFGHTLPAMNGAKAPLRGDERVYACKACAPTSNRQQRCRPKDSDIIAARTA
jgi:hypothetical protein